MLKISHSSSLKAATAFTYPFRHLVSYIHGLHLLSVHYFCVTLTRVLLQASSQNQGIQTLLEAEKEAAKVVQESRQCMLHSLYRHTYNVLGVSF